ncbi:MAG TPA: hypothetical protein VH061_07810 [Solirubrobacteraceae bacterium]|nr:hypothetical protein [Solirubrobacteraceae bacterium]
MGRVISGEPVARFSGPPADRMAGRSQARAARAQGNYAPGSAGATAAAKAKAKAATTASVEARANSFLAREDLLDRAVASGVINSGMRAHYAQAYDADPGGCRQFLAKLGLRDDAVVVAAEDDGLSLLTDAERENVANARAGRRPTFVHGG